MKTILKKIIGSRFKRELKKMQPILDAIHEHEKRLASLSDDDVKAQAENLRGLLKERYGAIEEELVAKKAAKHGCADPGERDELDREVHKLEDPLKDGIEAALNDTLPEAFATVQGFIGSILGRLLLFGWTLALFYHLCNGIRHLFWDAGYGFELDVAYRSGLAVLGASVALTLISWILGYSFAAP